MKRIALFLSMVLLLLSLAGCGSKSYTVQLKSGESFTSQGALEYDKKSETYSFQNTEGKQVILNKGDVKSIVEAE